MYPYISYDTTFIFFIKYAPVPSLYSSQVAYPGGAYTSFHSMKWLEVLQLPQGLEWQSIAKLTPPPPCISPGFPDNSCNMLDYEQFLVFSKVCPSSKKNQCKHTLMLVHQTKNWDKAHKRRHYRLSNSSMRHVDINYFFNWSFLFSPHTLLKRGATHSLVTHLLHTAKISNVKSIMWVIIG